MNRKFFLLFIVLTVATMSASADSRDTTRRKGVLEFLTWSHNWNGFHYDDKKIDRALDLIQKSGAGIIRMDFSWSDIEPQQGKFDFEKYDRLVDKILSRNIKILAILGYNSSWSLKEWYESPDPVAFTRYTEAVVARYKDRIRYWEIWNEPNHEIYWRPQDGMKAYSELLKQVYPAIKMIDPSARVLIGGLTNHAGKSLEAIYAANAGSSFDIMNAHYFGSPFDKDAWKLLRKEYDELLAVMKAHGDSSKPVWITEIGCPGVPNDAPATAQWWLGTNPNEATQARWVREVYTEILRWPSVEKVFWAFLRDTPNHFMTGTDYFGLVREDFTPKEAYGVFKDMDPTSSDAS